MPFAIEDFKASGLTLGGARPNLFDVTVTFPSSIPDGAAAFPKLAFTAKAAQLPGSMLGTIEVPYFGRFVRFPGDRTFEPWTVTVVNDEDFLVRNAFEQWSAFINAHAANVSLLGALSPFVYQTEAQVKQYGKDGSEIKAYNFTGLYPSEISPVELAWDANDALEEFTVTFQYAYWTSLGSNVA